MWRQLQRGRHALAETIKGLYIAEVIWRKGQGRSFEAVELATPEWVDWFKNRRLVEPIGNVPPTEAEAAHYAALEELRIATSLKPTGSGEPAAVHFHLVKVAAISA